MINVNLGEKSYPVFIEKYDFSEMNTRLLEFLENKNYVVVFSKKVYKLYGKIFDFNKKNIFVLDDGEKEKSFKNYKKIMDFCLKRNLTREDFIIAFGGGVVGDITGFVASTYMRGINFVQIPTTLLACVDSSVGGKNAINSNLGKNLIGCFYQPKAVFINVNFLKTLSLREFKTGLGEIVKYSFIEKSCGFEKFNFINFLNENYQKILDYDTNILLKVIEICIKLKISVIQKDEKENNLRKILNFGHTLGHSIEAYTKYKKYTHGECVIKGIRFAFDLALKNKLIEKDYYFIMEDLLKKFEFRQIPDIGIKKLIPIMKKDKKSLSDYILFILPNGFGEVGEYKFNDLLTIF